MNFTPKKFNLLLIFIILASLLGSILTTLYALNIYKDRSISLVNTKLQALEVSTKIDDAQLQKADLVKNKNNIELLQKIVPKSKDQALAVAELQAIASENNLSIGSINFPSSDLGSNKNVSTTQKITQTKTIEGISGVLGLELNISQLNRKLAPSGSGISYEQLINLLESIEKNRRTMQIKIIQIQPIVRNGSVVGYNPTITLNLFIKP